MGVYKSRRRWLAERWVAGKQAELGARWDALREQLLPASWPRRMQRVAELSEGETVSWQPRAGSSSAELLVWVEQLPGFQRRWLAALLDAPSAGPVTLIESIERAQLDWRSQVNPLTTHREYAAQLVILAAQMDLQPAAQAAYLENEKQIFTRLDELLFASLPMRLRAQLAGQHVTGQGFYLVWWYERLMARAGEPGFELLDIGAADWPDMPPAWLALGWLCGLRLQHQSRS